MDSAAPSVSNRHIAPHLPISGIACVRTYPDQQIENDYGDSCYDPNLPEAIVLRQKNELGRGVH